jgi:NADH-quinone oxidoreductase subunit A
MPQNYVPIFIFALVAFLVAAGTVAICALIRPKNPFKTKLMPYECGITPFDNARGRYTVRFYIVAILFVVFDVETIFLFPWAVQFKLLGLFGLLEMMIFLGILIVGYIWIWKKARWNGCSGIAWRAQRIDPICVRRRGWGFLFAVDGCGIRLRGR